MLIVLANYLAFLIRFDGVLTPDVMSLFTKMIPWLVVIRGLTFVPLQLYKGLWRYTGIWDLRNVIVGVIGSTVLFYILVHWIFGRQGLSFVDFYHRLAALDFFHWGESLDASPLPCGEAGWPRQAGFNLWGGRRWRDGCAGHKESWRPVRLSTSRFY